MLESSEELETYVEPWDVDSDEYIAYDSEGRLLGLSTVGHGRLVGPRRVILQPMEAEPTHSDELHDALVTFLRRIGLPEDRIADVELTKLIEISLNRLRPGERS